MRLFCDLDLQRFILGPNTTQELSSIQVKRGPATEIEVQFLRGVTPQELPASASGIFEVKTDDQFDSSPLTAALAWVKTGTGVDTIYTFTLGLINAPLDALLGVDALKTFTVVAATDLFTSTAHGLSAGNVIQFSSTVTLPAPLLPNVDYYVIASGLTANDFRVSTTLGGSTVNITDTGTGVHSWRRTTNDIETVTLMAAMQWVADGQTNETQTLAFILENDVVRDGDIPPAFPALVYAVFLPGITSLADFKAVPTVGMSLGYLVEILIDVGGVPSWLTYRLTSGPAVDPEPADVAPNDYNAGTNNVHWRGATGPSGGAGRSAGIAYKFNTATSGDPGSGKLLVNNATLASATQLNISETDDDGNGLAALLATWDDGTSTIRGRVVLHDPATPTNFAIFNITGSITDAGAYDTFVIAHVASGGTLTNGLAIRVFFEIKGDKGDSGDTGLKYVFNSATSGDPATGKFLFNNATFASATLFHVSETDGNGNTVAALLAAIDNSSSSNKVFVTAIKQGGAAFFSFYITAALTDVGAYNTFPITPVTSSGSIANGDTLFLNFSVVGDKGMVGRQINYLWNTSTANSDPTTGHVKVNNATLASATALYVSETDNDGNGLAALLATWDDSTSTIKGKLIISDISTPTNFRVYNITGTITDNGAWDTFTIAHVAGGGSFSNDLPVTLLFIPTGDKGGDGATTYAASSTIPAGSSANIDWATVTTGKRRTLTANTTFTHINMVDGKIVVIPVLNTASNYTVTWVGVDYWQTSGGTAPVQSIGAVLDVYTFFYDGTYVIGTWAPGT